MTLGPLPSDRHILVRGATMCGAPRTMGDATYDRARSDYRNQQLGRAVDCLECCELLRAQVSR